MNFEKENFNMGSGSERWVSYNGKFVARFKHFRPARSASCFVSFLCKNFTVDEYFNMLNAPMSGTTRTMAPLEILQTKGYISPAQKHVMKLKLA